MGFPLETTLYIIRLKMTINLLKTNRIFLSTFFLIWIVTFVWVTTASKFNQMEWINSHNSSWADTFFWLATQLGEGGFFVLVIIVCLFIKIEYSAMFALAFIISTIISQGLKLLFHTPRPLAFFEKLNHPWHFVDGIEVHIANSFPSGHTTTAFTIFTLIAFIGANKKISPIWVLVASLTGYSRSYLFQHFPEDVLGGAIVGLLSSILACNWIKSHPKEVYAKALLRKIGNS
jgi:membrane-associated phospholipid phosphatase